MFSGIVAEINLVGKTLDYMNKIYLPFVGLLRALNKLIESILNF